MNQSLSFSKGWTLEDYTTSPLEGYTPSPSEGYTSSPSEGYTPSPSEDYTSSPSEGYTSSPVRGTKISNLSILFSIVTVVYNNGINLKILMSH